jgi:hypothetical protein
MGIAYLYGNGGGGSGGNLSVSAPNGVVVTVFKDDKSYSKFVGTDGLAKFTGLEGGTWTVSITDETQTAMTTVNIKIDHSTTIAFFGATITATFPTATSECRCYYQDDPDIVYYATDEELAAGKAVFTVSKSGTWVTVCTDGIDTATNTVSITVNGQSSTISLAYHAYLYNKGIDYTGSYASSRGWSSGGWSGEYDGEQYTKGSVTTNANSITITSGGSSRDYTVNTRYQTKGNLALNVYSKLSINVTEFNGVTNSEESGWDGAFIAVMRTPSNTDDDGVKTATAYTQIKSTGVTTVNLASITNTTKYYIVIFCAGANITFTEVYLD